jgi:hypothetical protein
VKIQAEPEDLEKLELAALARKELLLALLAAASKASA